MRDLDRTDAAILTALQNDGRLPNKQLAAEAGLAPSSCSVRVAQLRRAGVLKGTHARVDPAALGIGLQAMIAIRLAQHSKDQLTEFTAHVTRLKEVVAVYHMGGASDFLIHVAVADANHLRELAIDAFTTRPEVGHMETALIFGFHQSASLPCYGHASEGGDASL